MKDRIESRRRELPRPSRSFWSGSAKLLLSGFLLSGVCAAQTAPHGFQEQPGIEEFSGRLIIRPVQFQDWLSRGSIALEAIEQRRRAQAVLSTLKVARSVRETDESIVELRPGESENGLARALMATGLFEYAEPDWVVYPIGCPNDPLLGNQWHHNANRMQSCDGWSLHTGNSTVTVGICDTGIRKTHEDFLLHRREGYNAVDQLFESQGGNIDPVHPHGTMTTGCAAANGNNGVGIAGVGWDLSHRMLRVSNTSSGSSSLSVLQHAARTSVENGDRIASVSYSGVDNSSNLTTATYIKSIGGLLVWAAGNDGRNLTFGDRDADDIIVAGGTDQNDAKASFSAYGIFVDLTAPAVSVYTADSGSDNDYAAVSGTSFATPLTAGLAALIWSFDPSLTPDQVESLLKQGCDDLGSAGLDNTFGYGRINVFQSLSLVSPGNQPPVASLSANPLSGDSPLPVDFDATGSVDPDGTIADYSWDFDGNGTYDSSTGTVPTTQNVYSTPGTYLAVVRVTDDQGATDTASVTLTVTSPGGPGVLASDGWESNTYSGGTGWTGAWTHTGDTSLRWNTDSPHTGSGHVRLRRSTGYLERTVNLTGATDVHLTFWARVSSFESSDQALIRVSSNGVNYTTVKTLTSANSDNTYRLHDISLAGFSMTSNFRIVFDAAMSSTNDRLFIDDIEIVGIR